MLNSDIPTRLPIPWASSGTKNSIPTTSQIGITDGKASYPDGFVPKNFTPIASSGVPPFGGDMNGVIYDLSRAIRWTQSGGKYFYDGTFATAIGGYPQGAIVQSADFTGFWRSTANSNTTDPDAGGAGWVPHFFQGVATQALSNANVTLTAAQYSRPIITLTGTLSGNVNVVLPSIAGSWTVINATGGAFNLVVKTSGGTGVLLRPGANPLYGDGTDVYYSVRDLQVVGTFSPIIEFGGTAVGQSYSAQDGYYVETGKKVDFWSLTIFTNKGSSTGPATLALSGCPNASFNANCQVSVDVMSGLPGHPSGLVITSGNVIQIRYLDLSTGSEASSLTDAHFTNTSALYAHGSYIST